MHIPLHGSRRATQRVCVRASFHLHVIHDVCLSVRCLSLRVCPSPVSLRRLPHSTCTLPSTSSPMSTAPREITAAPSHNEEQCPMAIYHPPTQPESRELRRGKSTLNFGRGERLTLCNAQETTLCKNKAELRTILKLIATPWAQGKVSAVCRGNFVIVTASRRKH